MPSSALVFLCAAALALLALAPAASLAAEAQPIGVIAQANDEEEEADTAPPRRRGVVTEEPEAAEDTTTPETQLPRLGASRRLDPFDHEEGPARGKRASSPVAAPSASGNVVVCMAGCDGPSGSVVYKK
jgi:hypothetical protein